MTFDPSQPAPAVSADDGGVAQAWQYSAYVAYMERAVDRRAELSRFHLTINTLLIGVIGFVFERALKAPDAIDNQSLLLAVLCLAGIGAAHVWRRLIISYRRMLRAKFEVIHELERALPSQPYLREYEVIQNRHMRTAISSLELWIPVLFMLVYFTFLIMQIPGVFGLACGAGLAELPYVGAACPAPA